MAALAVATTTAAALTSGGDCGGRGVREAESSEGGTVLHLQALGGWVGRGAVDEPTEEGAGEGEGGVRHRCRGFDGRGRGLPSPLSTSSSLTLSMTTTTTMTTMTTTRARSRGGGENPNEWDFEEVAGGERQWRTIRWRGRTGGGGWQTCKDCCVVLWLESYCIHRN